MKLETYNISLKHKIQELSFSGRLNDWEQGFLINLQCFPKLSDKQKEMINKMFDKYIIKKKPHNYNR
jgi:hypothetical protein